MVIICRIPCAGPTVGVVELSPVAARGAHGPGHAALRPTRSETEAALDVMVGEPTRSDANITDEELRRAEGLLSEDPHLASLLRSEIRALLDLPSYQAWLMGGT